MPDIFNIHSKLRAAPSLLVGICGFVLIGGCPSDGGETMIAAPPVDIVLSFDSVPVVSLPDAQLNDVESGDSAPVDRDVAVVPPMPDTQSTATFVRDIATADAAATDDVADDASPLAPVCTFDQDCRACAFPTAPTTLESCYCVLCAVDILPNAECEANAAQWNAVCGTGAWVEGRDCPTPRCIGAPAGACDAARQCVPACDLALCPTPSCPADEQVVDYGSCCPRCVGPSSCRAGRDCVHCNYTAFVDGPEGCYCPNCDTLPLAADICDSNRASWENHCRPWPQPTAPCDDVLCPIEPSPPECLPTGECSDHRDACRRAEQCTACPFATLPQSPGDCECPACPEARSRQHCEAILDATALHCTNFDYAACPQVDCTQTTPWCPYLGGLCELIEVLPR